MIEMMKEDERIRQVQQFSNEMKKLEGMKIGGLVNIAVGAGLFCLIYFTASEKGRGLCRFHSGVDRRRIAGLCHDSCSAAFLAVRRRLQGRQNGSKAQEEPHPARLEQAAGWGFSLRPG